MPNAEVVNPELLFVYDMQSGFVNRVRNWMRGIYAPHPPVCRLYALTHNAWGMDGEWQSFFRLLPMPKREIFSDQLVANGMNASSQTPSIFKREANGDLVEIVGAAELNQIENIAQLRRVLTAKLNLQSDFELLGITSLFN